MAEGWVKLERSIFEHWIFQDAEKFKAFVDLIQLARWKDEKLIIGNKIVIVPRGSYYTSELKLAERWGWSRNKTSDYLRLLEIDKMITKKGTSKGTMLTIANYRVYQDDGTTKDTSKGHQKEQHEVQQKEHQTNIKRYTKEEREEREEGKEREESKNNIKKEKKKTEFDLLIESYTDVEELSNTIYEFLKMRKTIKAPMTSNALKLMLAKLDKFTTTDHEKIAILEQSIMNSWKGIFKLKTDTGYKKSNGYYNQSSSMDNLQALYKEAEENEANGNN